MRCGRVGVKENLPSEARVLGPSVIATPGEMWTNTAGKQKFSAPEAMTDGEIEITIREYSESCAESKVAGFDGVELHGANGYLIEQFLNAAFNQRTDRLGGSVENRIRFALALALAVVDAAIGAIGADKVGIRISPYGVFNGSTSDADTDAVYFALATALNDRKIAYIYFVDHSSMGAPAPKPELYAQIRKTFHGAVVVREGFHDAAGAEKALEDNRGDLVAFGRSFLANPMLPKKLKTGAAQNKPGETTFYTPGPKG